jgi:hypothetical protein
MGNLPALLPNATPLVSRFFTKMSKKRQRRAVVNLQDNFSISAKFIVTVSNNYARISRKMGFTIEEKAFLLKCHFSNGVNRQPTKRLCILRPICVRQTFP